jgi:hypothetical protein
MNGTTKKGTHNMSYENAPQTHLLATHCIICSRPLCDAESVEAGIGPICRKKTEYAAVCTDENRVAANKLIHTVSCSKDTDERISAMNALLDLGFTGVVQAMLKAIADVKIALTDETHAHGAGRYAVKTPYSPAVVNAMRTISGRRWDKQGKVNTFPQTSKVALFQMLCDSYEGSIAVGPKGIFKVQTPKAKPVQTETETVTLKMVG